MKVEDGKIKGLRAHLERKVSYLVKTQDISEQDAWQAVYDIALRKLTLIIG